MISLKTLKNQNGFTLIEVLLVVAIISILAGIVIIAINPGKNLADARNSQRQADVTTILNAVYQYSLDNNGSTPSSIPTGTAGEICKTNTLPATCSSATLVDLTAVTTSGKYIASIPIDPSCPNGCNANGVGYQIIKETNGRITVSAPGAEGKTITVTR